MLNRKSLFAAAAFASMVGLGHSAQAMLVTTNNVVTFDSAGFENSTAGQNPGENDPAVGTWLYDHATVRNPTAVDSPTPGAFEGDLYLHIARTGAAPSRLNGVMTATASGTDVVRAEAMIYIPSDAAVDNLLNFVLESATDQVLVITGAAGEIRFQVPSGQETASVTYATNQWQHWVLEYDFAANEATFSIDGASDTFTPNPIGANPTITEFRIGGGVNNAIGFYVDAIPEPASLALLGLGGLAMLRRRVA